MVIFDRQKQKAVTDEASAVTAFLLYNALRMLQKDIIARENMMLIGWLRRFALKRVRDSISFVVNK